MNNIDDNQMWKVTRDLWRKGSVTKFLEEQISGLKDANGQPLPDHAKQFFLDLIYLRIKPPANEPNKIIYSEVAVKQIFDQNIEIERVKKYNESRNDSPKLREPTPKETALSKTAEIFNISESTVSEIIYPRNRK